MGGDVAAHPGWATGGAVAGRGCRQDGHLGIGQRVRNTAGRIEATVSRIAGRGRRATDQAAVSPRSVTPLALSWTTAVSGGGGFDARQKWTTYARQE
jgi:hypothetical protein